MSKGIFSTALVGAAVFTVAGVAQADVIVQYGTAGSTTSLAPVVVAPEVTADNLVAGTGIDVQAFSTFNFSNWDPANTSFADAVAADEVWTWGFDVTSLVDIDLTTMDIRLDRSSTGPDDFEIQASVNGGAATTVLTYNYNDGTVGVNFIGVDLSSIGTVSNGDSVVFTLGAFNAESTTGTFDLETITFPGDDGYRHQRHGDPRPRTRQPRADGPGRPGDGSPSLSGHASDNRALTGSIRHLQGWVFTGPPLFTARPTPTLGGQ